MTNEEKAKLEYPVTQASDVGFYCDVHARERQVFIKACEWKDQQFKEYLEKKLVDISKENSCGPHGVGCNQGKRIIVNEIINELFKED